MYGMLDLRHPLGVHRRPDGRTHAGISGQEDPGLRSADGDADRPRSSPLLILTFTAISSVSPRFGHIERLSTRVRTACRRCSTPTRRRRPTTGRRSAASASTRTWYNTTLGLTMLFGRFFMIVPPLALAGSLAPQEAAFRRRSGTFPVTTPLFTALLVGVIVIVGALTFFPALSLGPIVEHFLMQNGTGVLMASSERHDRKSIWDPRSSARGDRRRDPQAASADDGAQPGDVRRRDRRCPRDRARCCSDAVAGIGRSRHSNCRLRAGCGSPCCSPTSPRRWRKAAARRRPTRCAARRRRPRPSRERPDGTLEDWPVTQLRKGDVVRVAAGQVIPADGEIIEGVASVDESAITGESAPVIRESGGDRSAVTGGTRVLSDWIRVRVTANPGETFLDRMIALVEGAERQKTPNEIALSILLAGLTIVFLIAVVTLPAVRDLFRRAAVGVRAGLAARLPDSDHNRWSAVGDRHRRHGSPGPAQRARDVRSRGRGGRRRAYAAAGQDRHHHPRQPPGDGVHSGARRQRGHPGRSRTAGVAARRNAGRAIDRRAGEGEVRPARP